MEVAPVPPCVTDARAAAALLRDLTDHPEERAAMLYLDPKWRLLGRIDFPGSPAEVAPPLRTVIAEALRLDAAAMILAHTHPGGCTRPSAADLAYTRELGQVAAALDVILADHLILTVDAVFSFRDEGLL